MAVATRSGVALRHLVVPDLRRRRAVAGADAGRAHDTDVFADAFLQRRDQRVGTHHLAGERIADPDGDRRRARVVVAEHVEMGVERRDLVDLGQRELHLFRQRRHVVGRETALRILDQVEVLDQEIPPARPVAEQRAHPFRRSGIDLASLGPGPRPGPCRSGMPVCAYHPRAFRHAPETLKILPWRT